MWNEKLWLNNGNGGGLVHRRRASCGVNLYDLRDREGLVQIVCNPEGLLKLCRCEKYEVNMIEDWSVVKTATAGSENTDLRSGKIEIIAKRVTILNSSERLLSPWQNKLKLMKIFACVQRILIYVRREMLQKACAYRSKIIRQFTSISR